jgi:hypothetical protein
VVQIDPFLGDAEVAEDLTLSGEVLLLGRATRVADQGGCPGRRGISVTTVPVVIVT